MSDVVGLVGWSNSRWAGKKLDSLDNNEAIRRYVSDALQTDVADEAEVDETASLIQLMEDTLMSHKVSPTHM